MSPFPSASANSCAFVRRDGRKQRENLIVKLRFADGSYYDQNGEIDFVDVTVNKDTDTIMVRAKVPNPAGALTDGQYVRVVVQRDKPVEKIVIPQAALLANQSGPYVFVVEDGKAVPKQVKTGPEVGTGIAIEQGLTVGDLVVVSGPAEPAARRPGAGDSRRLPCRASRPTGGPSRERRLSDAFLRFRRSPATGDGHRDRDRDRGTDFAAQHSRRAISRYRAAAGVGDDDLSRRLGGGGGGDDRAADRGADRRRRQAPLYEERIGQRRQLYAAAIVRTRHQSRHQHRQRQ